MQRYYSDPVYRRQELDVKMEAVRLRKARDPEFHADRKLYDNKVMRQRRSVESYLRYERLSDWVRRSEWHKADLPWKEYRPILYPEKTTHHCSRCDWQDYRAKLWWSTIGSQGYLCGLCWAKLSWEEMCPTGFEDTATWKEFTARAKELGIAKP
jgi:hypothetical protein